MTNKPFTYSPGMPVDIDDIAAHVAYERGLGAGGSDAYKTLLRVAELTAIVAKTNQIVRLTDEGLVDVVTGVSLDDVEDARRRFRARYGTLETTMTDEAILRSIQKLRAEGVEI